MAGEHGDHLLNIITCGVLIHVVSLTHIFGQVFELSTTATAGPDFQGRLIESECGAGNGIVENRFVIKNFLADIFTTSRAGQVTARNSP